MPRKKAEPKVTVIELGAQQTTTISQKEYNFIREVINTYPRMDRQHNASFVIFSNNLASVSKNLLRACHYNMRAVGREVMDNVVTAVPFADRIDLMFLNWLKAVPFKLYKDYIHINYIMVNGKQAHYIKCTDLDKWPANVLYNFLIATRTVIEGHSGYGGGYYGEAGRKTLMSLTAKMVDAGVPIGIAHMCAQRFNLNGQQPDERTGDIMEWTVSDLTNPNGNHFWLDMITSWDDVFKGEFNGTVHEPYRERPDKVTPTNCCRKNFSRREGDEICGMTIAQLIERFGSEGHGITDSTLVSVRPAEKPVKPVVEDRDGDMALERETATVDLDDDF